MNGSGYLIGVYLTYGAVAVGLTVWLARTLFRNGAVFLSDVFDDRPEMAESVNRLLVVGFYMANLGYAFLLLQTSDASTAVSAVEVLVRKLGQLLITLAIVHFVNLYVFFRIRRRGRLAVLPPPVAPQVAVNQQQVTPWAAPQ